MPNIIDALIVTLGLDTTDFQRGKEAADKSLDSTGRKADETSRKVGGSQRRVQGALDDTGRASSKSADQVGKSSGRVNESLRGIVSQSTSVQKSFSAMGEAAATPLLGIAVGAGAATLAIMGVKNVLASTVATAGSGAALGRDASMAGIDLKKYIAWGNAIESVGYSAKDAQTTLSNFASQQQQTYITGVPSAALQTLVQFGINPNEDPTQIMRDLAGSKALHAMPAARRTAILQGLLQMDSGSAYAVSQGTDFVNNLLATQAAKGNIDPHDAQVMQDYYTSVANLKQAFDQMGTNLELDLMPGLTKFITTMTDWVNWLDLKFPDWFKQNVSDPTVQTSTAIERDVKGVTNQPALQYTQSQQDAINLGKKALSGSWLSPSEIAGVLGNVQGESGFNPHPTSNPNHWGMFQWDVNRRQAIKDHFGFDVATATPQQQYQAMLWELNTNPRFASLKTAFQKNPNMSPFEAARLFMEVFEAPVSLSDPNAAAKLAAAAQLRGAAATNIFSGALDPNNPDNPHPSDSGPAHRGRRDPSDLPLSVGKALNQSAPMPALPPPAGHSDTDPAFPGEGTASPASLKRAKAVSDRLHRVRGAAASVTHHSRTEVHHHHANRITINAPSGEPRRIAEEVRHQLRRHEELTSTKLGRNLG